MFHVKHIYDIEIYKLLYNLSYKSYRNNDIPVSSIIIYNNKIIGKGYNNRQKNNNIVGHAEINAIIDAEKKINDWRLNDCILISTLKPCEMCNQIIKEARINKVYYILDQKNIKYKENYNKLNVNNIYTEKYEKLFNDFFKKLR